MMAIDGYIRDLSLCAMICAGAYQDVEGGNVGPDLTTIYTIVLPLCGTCKSNGSKAIVGRCTHNGRKIVQQRLDTNVCAESVSARNL